MFSLTFIYILVVTALIWTGAGVLVLVGLLIRDWKNGTLW
jgi:hypothetical protein